MKEPFQSMFYDLVYIVSVWEKSFKYVSVNDVRPIGKQVIVYEGKT